jgi:hypothetical protein
MALRFDRYNGAIGAVSFMFVWRILPSSGTRGSTEILSVARVTSST